EPATRYVAFTRIRILPTPTLSMCPYLDTWVISQNASAALKYAEIHEGGGRRAQAAEIGAFVGGERHVALAVPAHRRHLQERGDGGDIRFEDDLAPGDRRIQSSRNPAHDSPPTRQPASSACASRTRG